MPKTSLILLAKLSPLLVDVVCNGEVGSVGGADEIVKRSLPKIKAIIVAIVHLILIGNVALLNKRKYLSKLLFLLF